jgi:hypothetical protein
MPTLLPALIALTLAQTNPSAEDAARSAQAAERAAQAAEKAANAAASSAAAVEKLVSAMQPGAKPAEAAAVSEAAPTGPIWSGSVGAGLISLTGNSESLTFSTTAAVERRTELWVMGLKAFGAYGQTRPADGGPTEVVALNAGAALRGDRKVISIASAYLMAGAETDHVKSLEYRALAEGGAGITWAEEKDDKFLRLLFRTDLALRYAYDSRFAYYPFAENLPDVTLVAPKLGIGFVYALNKNVSFREDAETLLNIAGESRVLVNSISKLSARLTEKLALGVSFTVNHDSAPAPGKKPTDTALGLTLEAGF